MVNCRHVTTTLPDKVGAEELAARVIAERLGACAQVVGPVSSTYRWQGEIRQSTEWFCHLKTTAARLPALMDRIRSLHPYEVPEIIAVSIDDADPDYLRWVESEVR
jgi:periplasmic divalent cation tolerance protein